jgi:periplasmic protein CpxP/Spy
MKLIGNWKLGAVLVPALLLLLFILSPVQALAQEEQGPPQGQGDARPPRRDGDLVRQLNLSPEQIDKIRAIREGNRELRRQIGQRIRAARIALDRAIYDENADEAVVEQRARELAEAQGAQIRLQAMVELGVRRILTPEQLQTFRDLRLRAERGNRPRQDGRRPPLRDGVQDEPLDAGRSPRQRRPGP